jgi:hypothetical protein
MKRKSKKTKDSKKASPPLDHIPKSLEELEHDELSGYEDRKTSLSSSSTDEEEDEGLGDGNIGRSNKNILGK